MSITLRLHNIICWILSFCTFIGVCMVPITPAIDMFGWHHELSLASLDIYVHMILVCAMGIGLYALSCAILVGDQYPEDFNE